MKAVAYAIERVASIDAAVQRLAGTEGAGKALAGGQSLGAMLNLRLAQPERLVDLDALGALHGVSETPQEVVFGAMTTHAQIEDGRVPDPGAGLMRHVARGIAYRAVRNRGTLGGSLCHADPSADWVSAMPLLGAVILLAGPDGRRELPAAAFMRSAFETALEDGELLVGVRVPRRSAAARWAYRKFCRKTGEFAEALVAALYDPADGSERLVIGALDGAPRVLERAGLLRGLADPARRAALLAEAGLGLDATRGALTAEMLRLVADDLGDLA